jgi:propionaldehyde dehydrogenase
MEADQKRIEEIVQQVLAQEEIKYLINEPLHISSNTRPGGELGIFNTIDEAVSAAENAFASWRHLPLKHRGEIIESIREVSRHKAGELAEMARNETGFGRADCKTNKNLLVADKTPGIELLEPQVFTGDNGLTLIERAPFGVIASITPSTNPTATIINHTIGMIAGGNTIVFNVHPRAKDVSVYTIQLINRTIVEMGGPVNVLTAIHEPTVESAQYLMKHPDIQLLVVTGGAEVVRIAMTSGKKTICAGPGNPPVVVDETADIEKAAELIVKGAAFDNNLVCSTEKEVFVVSSVADRLMASMCQKGAFMVPGEDIDRLSNYIFTELGPPGKPGKINLELVGQNASEILPDVGFRVPGSIKLAIMEVPPSHNLVWTEQMMPVLPIVRINNVDEAIQMALKAEQNFKHTAIIHSFHLPTMSKMAKVMDTSIFVKNASSFSGLGFRGEGHTSFTIGTRTGEGLTTCLDFTRERRCTLAEHFRIV